MPERFDFYNFPAFAVISQILFEFLLYFLLVATFSALLKHIVSLHPCRHILKRGET